MDSKTIIEVIKIKAKASIVTRDLIDRLRQEQDPAIAGLALSAAVACFIKIISGDNKRERDYMTKRMFDAIKEDIERLVRKQQEVE